MESFPEVANEMFFVVSGSVEEVLETSKVLNHANWPVFDIIVTWKVYLGSQSGVEKIEKTVHKGGGSGELAFFFGLRHIGNNELTFALSSLSTFQSQLMVSSGSKGKQANWRGLPPIAKRTIYHPFENVPRRRRESRTSSSDNIRTR